MPKNPCSILVYAHVRSDIDSIIFNHGTSFVLPLRGEELSDLSEPGEAPVAFLRSKSVARS